MLSGAICLTEDIFTVHFHINFGMTILYLQYFEICLCRSVEYVGCPLRLVVLESSIQVRCEVSWNFSIIHDQTCSLVSLIFTYASSSKHFMVYINGRNKILIDSSHWSAVFVPTIWLVYYYLMFYSLSSFWSWSGSSISIAINVSPNCLMYVAELK